MTTQSVRSQVLRVIQSKTSSLAEQVNYICLFTDWDYNGCYEATDEANQKFLNEILDSLTMEEADSIIAAN